MGCQSTKIRTRPSTGLQFIGEKHNFVKGLVRPTPERIFTHTSNIYWSAHLGGFTARGLWSIPKSRIHTNFMELKAVLLALKCFKNLCRNQTVLIAMKSNMVVAYIYKEGGMKSCSLCALLWRFRSWCNLRNIDLQARHIPGRLNVIADKLSDHNQVTLAEWSLHKGIFDLICKSWLTPQIDLFAPATTRNWPCSCPQSWTRKPGQWMH